LDRRDWVDLKQQAESLRTKFPDRLDGFILGEAALLGLGQQDAAESLLAEAIEYFPDHAQLMIERAWLVHKRRDWAEAKRQWQAIKRIFPTQKAGYIGVGLAEREARLFDEADASFTQALACFPNNPAALIEHAWVAHHRGDFPEARRRWKKLREQFPENRYAYLGAGITEQSACEFDAAEALLASGHRRFPTDRAIAIGHAWTANLRREWATAVARWQSLAQIYPTDKEIARGLDATHRAMNEHEIPAPSQAHSEYSQCRSVGVSDLGVTENGVLIGRNNMLFLAEGGHAVLEYASGRRKVSEESYSNFLRNLLQRHRAATSHGAIFLHVIYPDKHSVYTEDFPVDNPVLLGLQYLKRFPALAHYINYPRERLRQASKPTFMQTDTHLTDYGTILTSADIVSQLVGESQTASVASLVAGTNLDVQWSGDLGSKLSPPRSEIRFNNPMTWIRNWYHNNLTGGNNGIVDIYFNKEAAYGKRLVWFGDSFGRSACQFISYYFKEVVFLRTPFFHPDIFEQIQPDYLITQNVERYLNFVHSDDVRPSFFMYPHLSGQSYGPNGDFAKAMSAVLSYGRKPYSEFLSTIGM
jgi:tetratricopeptide (TPR) repeat protein